MKRHSITILLAMALAMPTFAQEKDKSQEAISTIKKMIGYIRYKKNEKALESLGMDQISAYLLDKYYAKTKPADKQKFKALVAEYISLRAFPLAYKYFKDIDLSFDKPQAQEDGRIHVKSSLLYAGSERLTFTWILADVEGSLLMVDFLNEKNVSSMKNSRDKQIIPVYEKRGMKGLLGLLEKQVEKLRKSAK